MQLGAPMTVASKTTASDSSTMTNYFLFISFKITRKSLGIRKFDRFNLNYKCSH